MQTKAKLDMQSPKDERYAKDKPVLEAKRLAQEIAFAPVVFQVSRLMVKLGLFQHLADHKDGLTAEELVERTGLSAYAVQVLLESSLTIGTVLLRNNRYLIAKAGYFLLTDPLVKVNMDFNHDVNYLGLFDLEAAILNGKPEGLKVFGQWPTIYEGLSQLPKDVQKSWFGFDHFYSDTAFDQALQVVFARNTRTLLDVGGNTGRWATRCVQHNAEVEVTIMDLPQQLVMMREQTKHLPEANRIHGHGANLLDPQTVFPTGFDAIWMSQFLDCFSNAEVESILTRAAKSMQPSTRLYIMETIWDRQPYPLASFCLAQTSVYFTAMANGNSKMFLADDLLNCIDRAGLSIENIHDGIGFGHCIVQCKQK